MSDLYFGIDAAGNKHVHVMGTCYTNDGLRDALEAKDQRIAEQQQEIELLRSQANVDDQLLDKHIAENERLRAALQDIAKMNKGIFGNIAKAALKQETET